MIIQIKSNKHSIDFDRNNEHIVCQFTTQCQGGKPVAAGITIYYGMLNTFYFISKDIEALKTAYNRILRARAFSDIDSVNGVITIEIQEGL